MKRICVVLMSVLLSGCRALSPELEKDAIEITEFELESIKQDVEEFKSKSKVPEITPKPPLKVTNEK